MTQHGESPELDVALITPGPPWRPVEVLPEVGSTNAVLREAPVSWRVVVAERQVEGRGRLGRDWVTVQGRGLAVSALVPAEGMPVGWVPLTAGLALAEAIGEVSGVEAVLKWPNDVQLPANDHRKVAGILCEWVPLDGGGVIVGAGVNVHHTREELPVPEATSVALAGGACTREALLTAYLRLLAGHLRTLASDPAAVRESYAARCASLGAEVIVHEPAGERHGRVTAIDEEGRLCLQGEDGPVAVAAGDVVHVRTQGQG
jgi:BirA family biotin operon repressor/biotin-[acetyl-CoA-carboxylase] ligase